MAPDPDETPVRCGVPVALRPKRRRPTFTTRHIAVMVFLLLAVAAIWLLLKSLEPSHAAGATIGRTDELRQFLLGADVKLDTERRTGQRIEYVFLPDPARPACRLVAFAKSDGGLLAVHMHLPLPAADSRLGAADDRPMALAAALLKRFFPACHERFETLRRDGTLTAGPGRFHPEGQAHHMTWHTLDLPDGSMLQLDITADPT
jgi:hypothetical protein